MVLPHQSGRPDITKRAVWFVTGCSTGFGRELATQLLQQESRVVVTARDPSDLGDFKDARDALILQLDVTDPAQVTAAVAAAEARFGHIDVLVNNAGIGYFAAIEEGEDAAIRRMFDINVFGMGAMACGRPRAIGPVTRCAP